MAEKRFGVKQINFISTSGTPTIDSPNNLDLKANTVAISTHATIGGNLNVSGFSTFVGNAEFKNNINIGNNDRIIFGDLNNFQIYHDGTQSWLLNGTGDLYLRTDLGKSVIFQDGSSDHLAKFNSNGSAELYYDNSKKFETLGVGVTITGTTFTNQLNVSGVSTFSDRLDVSEAVYLGTVGGNAGFRISRFGGKNIFESTSGPFEFTGNGGQVNLVNQNLNISGLTTTTNLNVTGVSTLSSNVSVGGTINVSGGVKLATNNATIVGTSGTVGEIKQIAGAPFYYDGSAWREFVLSSGTPVTVPADTEWDNVIFRATFDDNFTDAKFGATPVHIGTGASITAAPLKIGTGAFRSLPVGSGVSYASRAEYDFTGSFTIEFWLYVDSSPGVNVRRPIISGKTISGLGDWSLDLGQDLYGNWYFRWNNRNKLVSGVYYQSLYGTGAAAANSEILQKWVHIALVKQAPTGDLHFYINGVESNITSGSATIDNDILPTDSSLLITGTANQTLYPFDSQVSYQILDGSIDDLRITTDARYTSVGTATTVFTPPTTALPITGTLSSYVQPPGDKYGEITLGGSPTWRGTSGVTVSQQSSGNYRVSFASTYTNSNDYYVLSQGMDQGFASYVGIARSTTHVDLSINKQSDDTAVNTGSLAVQIKNHI